jgi:hypothetical protein
MRLSSITMRRIITMTTTIRTKFLEDLDLNRLQIRIDDFYSNNPEITKENVIKVYWNRVFIPRSEDFLKHNPPQIMNAIMIQYEVKNKDKDERKEEEEAYK